MFNNGYLASNEDTSVKEDIQSLRKFFLFIKKDYRISSDPSKQLYVD
ncbi:site-specific recombinase XerD [Clostridium beijerinckii]|nr:site-specific recombinase XerD [Clostridium beijerinckii]